MRRNRKHAPILTCAKKTEGQLPQVKWFQVELSMNIYFSCSITGGRQDQKIYKQIVQFLLAEGHQVPTAHLSDPQIMVEESHITPAEVYARDEAWVRNCDVLVAEVSTPSHGVGYEIALAEKYHKPIFCCYKAGTKVSKMITGNPNTYLSIFPYTTANELLQALHAFLQNHTAD